MNRILLFFAFAILLSCKKDDNDYRTPTLGTYTGLRHTFVVPTGAQFLDTVAINVKKEADDSSLVFTGDDELVFVLKKNYSFSKLDDGYNLFTGQFIIADSLYFHKQTSSGSVHTYYYLKK